MPPVACHIPGTLALDLLAASAHACPRQDAQEKRTANLILRGAVSDRAVTMAGCFLDQTDSRPLKSYIAADTLGKDVEVLARIHDMPAVMTCLQKLEAG